MIAKKSHKVLGPEVYKQKGISGSVNAEAIKIFNS